MRKEAAEMPRRKSIASIDAKISDLQKKAAAAKERYERLCRELLQLQHERELAMGQEILSAMKKSGKSYREIMTFLGSPWGLRKLFKTPSLRDGVSRFV